MTNELKPVEVDEASEERSTAITIGDREYRLILTTKATKAIAKRYGGLEKLGEKLMKTVPSMVGLLKVMESPLVARLVAGILKITR
jgi:hypothetical protein